MIKDHKKEASLVTSKQVPPEDEVAAAVNDELGNSSYYAMRSVHCDSCDGILVLRGTVPSYFLKQLAQTVVRRRTNGLMRIDNQLEVVYDRHG